MDSNSRKTSGGSITTAVSPGAVRPRFRERQVLRAADLEAQQSYLIAARRRHNIGQHGWGIVQGLEINDKPVLVVQPGMAVDGYGRELIVTSTVTIPNSVFTDLGDDTLDVWLVYQLVDVNVPQQGNWSCGPGKNTRTREQITTLRLTASPHNLQPATPSNLPPTPLQPRLPFEVPREPIEVPDADLPFLPHRTPPDDPEMEWPVYLGTIRQLIDPPYDPASPRPYATLTGQVVTATSGLARMQIDAESPSDTRQFAVEVAGSSGKLTERLSIDREGNTLITGNTTVKIAADTLDTAINANHLTLGPARLLNFRPLAATPAAAAPWQIYRTSVTEDNATVRQLRFEFFHPGDKGEPASNRFAIGTRDKLGVFSPCFSVSADCTLTLTNNLTIGGQLVEGPIQADPADLRFGALVAQVWAAGTKVGEVKATTGTITGIVTNTADEPMQNVNVNLKLVTKDFEARAHTNDLGRYTALQIPIGNYTISANAPGFEPASDTATLTASPSLVVSFKLRRIRPIHGNVRDTLGAAIPNASLAFTDTITGDVTTVNTNISGVFDFEPLTVGPYSVLVTAQGFLPQTVAAAPGDVLNITLQTPPPPPTRIRGTVIDSTGAAVSGAFVEFRNQGTGNLFSTTTDGDGRFNSPPLTPGTYEVRVSAPGFVTQIVTAALGETVTITLQPFNPGPP